MWQIILFLLLFLIFPARAQAVLVSEVAYDIEGADADREWVEFFNDQPATVELTGGYFVDTSYHTLSPPGDLSTIAIPAQTYFVIADDSSRFLSDHPSFTGLLIDSVMSLPNYSKTRTDPISIRLADRHKQDLVSTAYLPTVRGVQGYTLERASDGSWHDSAIVGGTPGQANSEGSISNNYADQVKLSEILVNPQGSDTGQEWIELANLSNATVRLEGWAVATSNDDQSTRSKQLLGDIMIGPGQWLVIDGLKISLRNSNERIALIAPDETIIDQTLLAGAAPEGESWARFDSGWQWTTQLSPGAANILARPLPTPSRPPATPRNGSPSVAKSRVPTSSPTINRSGAIALAAGSKPGNISPATRPATRDSRTIKPSIRPMPLRTIETIRPVGSTTSNHWLYGGLIGGLLIGLGIAYRWWSYRRLQRSLITDPG